MNYTHDSVDAVGNTGPVFPSPKTSSIILARLTMQRIVERVDEQHIFRRLIATGIGVLAGQVSVGREQVLVSGHAHRFIGS